MDAKPAPSKSGRHEVPVTENKIKSTVGIRLSGGNKFLLRVAKRLNIQVPIRLSFSTLEATTAWVMEHPIEVMLDGKPVPCAAFAESPGKVLVQFKIKPGKHSLLVSSLQPAWGQAAPQRIVYVAQEICVAKQKKGAAKTHKPPP